MTMLCLNSLSHFFQTQIYLCFGGYFLHWILSRNYILGSCALGCLIRHSLQNLLLKRKVAQQTLLFQSFDSQLFQYLWRVCYKTHWEGVMISVSEILIWFPVLILLSIWLRISEIRYFGWTTFLFRAFGTSSR